MLRCLPRTAVGLVLAVVVASALGRPVGAAPRPDCGDYATQAAQDALNSDLTDPNHLDTDFDGLACEPSQEAALAWQAGGLAGLVACVATRAARRTEVMLPAGRTVYLEADAASADPADRWLRYVWFKGKDDGKPYLANEILIREGFGVVSTAPGLKHATRLTAAQREASADRIGL